MLQVQNLVKIYKPKKGVPVKALDNVSLTFPEKGMVFLLGKSGSGKSTLLNVLGGLDRYNSGEILIQGKSTRKFRQSHFDSYRNTYVGFIFQEYNILDEFSVGANIALALQLQGQKPDSERINAILKEVDLEGYGNRKPNELSGGQKQRVAIARALVKSPKIIMADEPTGALDSVTGRQVLATLKKLSQDKLVIIVSHDREFAEQYADRIIELADGKVIRDVERRAEVGELESAEPVYMEDSVSIPEEYVLTEADKVAICEYIQKMVDTRRQPKISLFGKQSAAFRPTNTSRIATSQEGYKLIKSRLPLKYAFKMGASGLKHKKFRLVMTVFLSCISLVLFGLTDTIASYSYEETAYQSLMDQENKIHYATFEKQVMSDEYWGMPTLTDEDIERIEDYTGLDMYRVYGNMDLGMYRNLYKDPYNGYSGYYMSNFGGYLVADEDLLEDMGAEIVKGDLPEENTNQVMISTVVLETFEEFGYRGYDPETGMDIEEEIDSAKDMIGKTLNISGMEFEVCGIVDTGLDISRYEDLKKMTYEDMENMSFMEQMALQVRERELRYAQNYSLAGLLMVAPGYEQLLSSQSSLQRIGECTSIESPYFTLDGLYDSLKTALPDASQIVWLDGQARTKLADNEIVLSEDVYNNLIMDVRDENLFFGEKYYQEMNEGITPDYSAIMDMELTVYVDPMRIGYEGKTETRTMKIVGIIPSESGGGWNVYMPQSILSEIKLEDKMGGMGGVMQVLAPMPEDPEQVRKLVEFSAIDFDDDEEFTEYYNLMNPVTFELKNLDEVFKILQQVFFWVGLVFVVFASLLFSNFIAISISYKKQEIGILRAIGSRSNDVFRIFFAESFCIAMINFTLSLAGTIGVCAVINMLAKESIGLLLTILNVGVRQVGLLLGVCLLSAFVASYLPVRKIASKRPIDAIRDR